MGEWREVPLGDVIELKRGYDLPQKERVEGTVPLVSSSGVTDRHAVSMAKGPGVVTGRYGTLGQVFYIPEDFWPLNTTLYVRDFKGNDPRFVSYLLSSIDFHAYSDKAAVPGLNRNHLHQAIVRLPADPSEQAAIASILAALDDKISLNSQINTTLEQLARLVFEDWFVQFRPTKAKAEGKSSYLSEDVWSLFPTDIDDSGKPEGWEESTIGVEAKCVGGGTPSTSNPAYWDGDIGWVTPKDLSRLKTPVLLSTDRTISKEGLGKISSGLLPVGTVLMSSRAPIGYIAIAECPVAINQGFIAMKCEGRLSNLFVWQWLRANVDAILQKANGSTFQEISKTNFRPLPVIVPSDQLRVEFDNVVRPLYEQICANEMESRSLLHMRDMLLPILLSGEAKLAAFVRAS